MRLLFTVLACLISVSLFGQNSIANNIENLEDTSSLGDCFNIQNICTGNPYQSIVEITFCLGYENGIESININWGNTLSDGTDVITTHAVPQFPWDDFDLPGQFNIQSPPYDNFGYYTIQIDLIGENECTTSFVEGFFISNNPTIGIGNPGNTDGICTPTDLTFPIFNFETNDPTTVYWIDFGDGSGQELFADAVGSQLADINGNPISYFANEIYSHEYMINYISELTHTYTNTSCGETTPLGSQNAYIMTVIAANACGTAQGAIEPIRIHGTPDPIISGPQTGCVNQPYTYTSPPSGTWVDNNSLDCTAESGYWQVQLPPGGPDNIAMSEANPFYSNTQQEYFTTTFLEEGEYIINVLENHPVCGSSEDNHTICIYPEQLNPVIYYDVLACNSDIVQLKIYDNEAENCWDINQEWSINSMGGISLESGYTLNSDSVIVYTTNGSEVNISLNQSSNLECNLEETVTTSIFLLCGCTDPTACNYNIDATDSDDSCEHPPFGYNCDGFPEPITICDEIDLNGSTLGAHPCNIFFQIAPVEFTYDEDVYDATIEYLWELGDNDFPDQNVVILTNDLLFSYDELTLTVNIVLANINDPNDIIEFSCYETYSMGEIIDSYDYFSCECQPGGDPVADFNVVNEDDCGNVGIGFENTSTGGFGSNYSWEFGVDGEYGVSSESSPTMNIIINGGYTETIPVTLTITDSNECQNSITQDVDILETPYAGETPCFNIQNICTGNPNQVTTQVNFCSGYENGIQEIIINWGDPLDDGSSVITSHPAPQFPWDDFDLPGQFNIQSPPYDDFGYYTIIIDLIGENGCTTTIVDDIFIGNNPTIGVGNPGSTDGVCTPYDATFPIFNYETNDPSTVYWVDFGDGSGQELAADFIGSQLADANGNPISYFANEIYNHEDMINLITEVYYTYEYTSCGFETPLGSQNAFMFLIIASNECGTSQGAIDPIRIYDCEDNLDCDGNCINDEDNDGICDEDEVLGCTILEACNYNEAATDNDESCIFIGDSCDDGDSNTLDDEIQEDCECSGTPNSVVDEIEALAVLIYPNPASNNLTVDLGDLKGVKTSIKIYDSSSKLVFEKKSTSTLTIDVSGYAKGMYSVELRTEDKILRSQIFVE